MQAFCIPLALYITTLFVEWGGYAMTNMMMGVAGGAQSAGAEAMKKTATPDGQASTLEGYRGAMPTLANTHRYDWQSDINQRTATTMARTQAGIDTVAAFGGVPSAISTMAAKAIIRYGDRWSDRTAGDKYLGWSEQCIAKFVEYCRSQEL